MRRLTVILVAGVAVAFFGMPSSSQAIPFGTDKPFATAVRKCDKALQLEAWKFKKDVELRLRLCSDFTLKEAFKDAGYVASGTPEKANYAAVAAKCEGQLFKALDPASGKIKKMFDKIDGLYSGDCGFVSGGQLAAGSAGHLTGGSAPGGSATWMKAWLATTMSADALSFNATASQHQWDVIDTLITRAELDKSPTDAPKVNCESGGGDHPLLCTLHIDREGSANVGLGPPSPTKGSWGSMCNTHACVVDETVSEAVVRLATSGTGTEPIQLTLDGTTVQEFCKINEVPFIPSLGAGADIRLVRSVNSRSLKPAVLDADTVVCIETTGGEGWCDCSGEGISFDYDFCVDHTLDNGNDCTTAGPGDDLGFTETEEQCFCTASDDPCGGFLQPACVPTTPCKAHTECGTGERCSSSQGGARCHPGTVVRGQIIVNGTSGVGDCYIGSSTQLTVTAVSGDSGGICASNNSTGPDGADNCNPLGGDGCTDCRPKIGPDEVPCTDDDLLPRTAPNQIPSTTGVAKSWTYDAIQSGGDGRCTVGAPGPACIEDRNCAGKCSVTDTTFCNVDSTTGAACTDDTDCAEGQECQDGKCSDCPAGETCDGSLGLCDSPAPTLITVDTPSIEGQPLPSCDVLETSNVADWEYVNSFAFNDAATLADGTNRSRFICK